MLPGQRRLWDSETFLTAYIGGFGSGKTMGGCFKALQLASENMGCDGALVSPSMPFAKKTIVPTMKSILNGLDFKYTHRKSSPCYIEIPFFNCRIHILSGDRPDSLRGVNLAWFVLDEPFIQDKEVFDRMLERVRDPNATRLQVVLMGTPEQYNWGFDLLEDCPSDGTAIPFTETNKKRKIQVSSRENYYLTPEYVANLEAQYDKRMVQAYIDGDFVPLTKGPVYYNFDRNVHVKKLEYDPYLPVFMAWDFNVDPMSVLIGQRVSTKEIRFLREVSIPGSNTIEACEEVKRVMVEIEVKGGITVFGDASGHSRNTKSAQTNQTDYDLISERFPLANLKIPRRDPPIAYRYGLVNGKLCNVKNEIGMYIDPSCKELIRDMLELSYKPGTRVLDNALKLKRTHKSDAAGYAICAYASEEQPGVRYLGKAV